MYIMINKTHTMTLVISKNDIVQIVETIFYPKQTINLPSLLW